MKKKGNRRKTPKLTWKGKEVDFICTEYKGYDEDNPKTLMHVDGKEVKIAESKFKKMVTHWDNECNRRDNV